MAADIAEDAAEEFLFVEPVRAAFPLAMRADAERLHHSANRALLHQLPGKHRALDVQTLAVIDRIFPPGLRHFAFSGFQLGEGG